MFRPAARIRGIFTLVALVSAAVVVHAAPLTYWLSFDTLPSAQGMSYTAVGLHASTLEPNVYAVHGGALALNSLPEPCQFAAGSAMYVGLVGQVTSNEPKRLRVSARCLQTVGTGPSTDGRGGFSFGFTDGTTQYGCSISSTTVFALNGSGWAPQPATYDNSTEFHEYRVEFDPPSTQRIYRDDVLVFSNSTGFPVAVSRVFLGDGTGAANAHAEVRSFIFEQVAVLDAPAGRPTSLALRGATRNPAPRSHVDVAFTLKSDAPAELALFDVGGRRVAAVPVGARGAGSHVVRLTPTVSLACGVYWLHLEQAGERRVSKVVLAD